jgi:hypothetical protein
MGGWKMTAHRGKTLVCLLSVAALILGLLVFLAASTSPAAADGETWVDTKGPGEGDAHDLVYVPERNELYRAANQGVWCYEPSTATWSDTGGEVSDLVIYSLVWDGTGLYAGTAANGVWRYDPVMGTWIKTEQSNTYTINELVWDGSVLYVGTDNHGVWRYDPAAGAWVSTAAPFSDVLSLAWDGTFVYAGGRYNGVWRYDPAAGAWVDTASAPFNTYDIISLAWDGTFLYAGTRQHGVWRYDSRFGTWSVEAGIDDYDVTSLALDDSSLFVSIERSTYAPITNGGVWRHYLGTDTWINISGAIDNFYIYDLEWDGSGLYAGMRGRGVWHYSPSTDTWINTGGSMTSSYDVSSLAWDGSGLYAGCTGVWYYEPSTSTWSNTGGAFSVFRVYSLAWDGSGLYAGIYAYIPHSKRYHVWHYEPGTANWAEISSYPEDNEGFRSMVWGGSSLYVLTDWSDVWRYDPGTDNWTEIGAGAGDYTIRSLAWDGYSLYASGYVVTQVIFDKVPIAYNNVVLRYDPVTNSWTRVLVEGTLLIPIQYSLAVDGSGLYVAKGDYGIVWRYDPATGKWADICGLRSGYGIDSLVWDESGLYALVYYMVPETVRRKVDKGLWRYDFQTGDWTDINGEASGHKINHLLWGGSSLYAGVDNHGVWRYACFAPPYVSSVIPDSGYAGIEVTISGSGFGDVRGSSSVSFASTQVTDYISWSDTKIVCRVPDMAPGDVQVAVSVAGKTSNEVPYTVIEATPLTVTSVTPDQGSQLSLTSDLTIGGSGFESGAAVRLEKGDITINAQGIKVVSDMEIKCAVWTFAADPGTYDLVVENPDGREARLTDGFRILNLCGQGAGASLAVFGLFMGLLSLAGTGIFRRRRRRK